MHKNVGNLERIAYRKFIYRQLILFWQSWLDMLITIFLLSMKSKQTETVLSKREIFIKLLMCIIFKEISYRSTKNFHSNNFILKTYT